MAGEEREFPEHLVEMRVRRLVLRRAAAVQPQPAPRPPGNDAAHDDAEEPPSNDCP